MSDPRAWFDTLKMFQEGNGLGGTLTRGLGAASILVSSPLTITAGARPFSMQCAVGL